MIKVIEDGTKSMKRLVIITVGKTHSGKTTFAKALEQELLNSLVIDQDNHAEFINTYYRSLLPKEGPNKIKYAISRTIVDYAVNETNQHLIICNSNRERQGRLNLLDEFHQKGFTTILVHFDVPNQVLQDRIAKSERSTIIFRVATSFEEVLTRQNAEDRKADVIAPEEGEADHLFVIKDSTDVRSVIRDIVELS